MQNKNHSVFDEQMKYVKNDNLKPFNMYIIHYYEWVRENLELKKYLSPPSKKNEELQETN